MIDSAFAGRRVLVTGHTGFKGSWLCEWLLGLGAEVSGLGLPPATTPSLFELLGLERRLRHRIADVRDAAEVRRIVAEARPEVIFHLAAQPLVRASYEDPKGTFDTNVGGTVNVLEAVRATPGVRACVVITSDKCYLNQEWPWGYRETDPLGGHDPYSASKGATELVVASYRRSFFHDGETCLASARAGNVLGGGDWSKDRIAADFFTCIPEDRPLVLRNPHATRPWQHVLEALSGYLHLGAHLLSPDGRRHADAWNFGPADTSVTTVLRLAQRLVAEWGRGEIRILPRPDQPHEAGLLKLDCSKAFARLGWRSIWDVDTTVRHTVAWYRGFYAGADARALTGRQIEAYMSDWRAAAEVG